MKYVLFFSKPFLRLQTKIEDSVSSVSSRNNYVATTEWLSADNIRRILGKVKVGSRRIFHQFGYVFFNLKTIASSVSYRRC